MLLRIIIYGILCVIIGYLISAAQRELHKEQIKDILNELELDVKSEDIISKSATVVLIRNNTESVNDELINGMIIFDNDSEDMYVMSSKDICDIQDDITDSNEKSN